jgi:hypothetical protein
LKDIEVVEGSPLELTTSISSCYPVPDAQWLKEENILEPSETIKFEVVDSDYKLLLPVSTEMDSGNYTFKTSNELGAAETSCTAKVLCECPFYFEYNFDLF